MLRDYQQRAIDQLYAWFESNAGNPCLVLPTGAGKSHIIAALCKDALQSWPDTSILMLTHVKELIEQNAAKMREHWPNAPMGIYSASIGKRQLGEPITFAGIQSVRNKASQIGHVDLVLIDECHLVGHNDEGGYRDLIKALKAINPALRIIGLTATPYRLGHGLITDKPALFDGLIEPVSIEELIYKGHLSTLRSKITKSRLDTSGVHKRGGEFIESELQSAVDTDDQNQRIVDEIIALADNRKSWLIFCTGVNHAQHIAEVMNDRGIPTGCIIGSTSKTEREELIRKFKAGEIRAMTNANVLTTGFDCPDIDLISMLRPSMSASLYVQMAGRGMRPKSHTDHCLVLDFAGVVATHGPITAVKPPTKAGSGNGEAPIKVCDICGELVAISTMICPACHTPFPAREEKILALRHDDIMGIEGTDLFVTGWNWRKHIGKSSGNEMLAVTYYGDLSDTPVTEYFPILNEGYAGNKARKELFNISRHAECDIENEQELMEMARKLNASRPPEKVEYKKDGKFYRVVKREF